ncbi:MAG: penicillin-binding protein 2 [Coriobacteriia bacterium]|nr:penicillin-binding protein 2 [Coriobacteriia bacterium]
MRAPFARFASTFQGGAFAPVYRWLPIVLGIALVGVIVATIVVVARHRSERLQAGLGPLRARDLDLRKADPGPARPPATGPQVGAASKEGDGGAVEASLRTRIRVMEGVVGAFFGALVVRLWGMQLLSSDDYSAQAERNLTREVSTRAPRGRILDRNGEVLVGNRSSMTLVADADVVNDTRVVRRISNLLGMPDVAVRRAIQNTTEGAQSRRTVLIDVPERAVAYVVEHPAQFPGVSVESRTVRTYPHGSLAAHLLGYSGTITDLEGQNSREGNHIQYVSGDIVGMSGIEYEYEGVLQGVRGSRTVHVDANGTVIGTVSEIPPTQGSDVRLTIDLNIQQAAEDAIQTGLEVGRFLEFEPTGAAVVCMDCKTGELLAMASWPTFDPNAFIGGISTDLWAQLQAEEANTPLLNRAINGLYPSASTIKPFTALAGLASGLIGYYTPFYCPGYWTGLGEPGMWCWNHDGHKNIDLHTGITNSCDAVFYEIAKAVAYSDQPEALQKMFRLWGLGSQTGIDLPGESAGRVPDAEWKWNWYTSADDQARAWQPGDTANISIGQGDILVTPMQLCYAYSGLVAHGTQMRPHVMKEILSSETQQAIKTVEPTVAKSVPVSEEDLAFIDQALVGVISEVGNVGSYFDGLPVQVMGKSGTGEAGDDPLNTHAWFVAAAPADDPQYVVASLVEHGGGGGGVSTHMCRQVLGAIYGVPMTDPIALVVAGNEERRSEGGATD